MEKSGTIHSLCILLNIITGIHGSNEEFRLVKYLLSPDRYDVNVRPAESINDSITVYLNLSINQLIDLDEVNQILTLKVWVTMGWKDVGLQWNETDYGGLEEIRIKQEQLWKPDITLYEDVSMFNQETEKYFPARVFSNGDVQFNAPKILKTSCRLDVRYFPWDQQIDVMNGSVSGSTENFILSGEWHLVGFPVRRNLTTYSSGIPYPDVTFYCIMNRKPLYYLFNLVLPCVFITATTVLVFYLPPDSGEKVSLGVTVLLALTVFLLMVAEAMPPQSMSIPLMAAYFATTIVLLAASTALTVVVLNIHHRGVFGNKVPNWVRTLMLNWLATILLLKDKVNNNLSKERDEVGNKPIRLKETYQNNNVCQNGTSIIIKDFSNSAYVDDEFDNHDVSTRTFGSDSKQYSDQLLTKILHLMKDFKKAHEEKKTEEQCRTDWMLVAMVLDRCLLIVFVILTIASSLGILLNHPAYNNDAESLV